jgi:hypothetical protein
MKNYYSRKKDYSNDFPRTHDFPNNIMLSNNATDYNIIVSRSNNRRYNNWVNNPTRIQGFDNKYYKVSSGIPKMQDTTSYFHMNKVYNFKYSNEIPKDTLDLMLIRQNIDKKQRYDLVNNKKLKYGKYTLASRRFNL